MANRSRKASAPLAAAAATATLSDAAQATTQNEIGDFGDDFASSTLLPVGTDVVNGGVFAFEADSNDFVTFQGLLPGGSFELDATLGSGNGSFVLGWLDDGGGFLTADGSDPFEIAGTIPASGQLHFSMFVEGDPSTAGFSYTLNLSAPLPEPATAALLGGGLLAAALLRRLRARDGS